MNNFCIKKCGFTLAEVLITLTVVGVVAGLTIPQLVKNMNDYAFQKSKAVMLAKITEATNQMRANDDLDGYATTEAFADEFQKYLKISKRCTSANLTDCFAPKFTSPGGKQVVTTTLVTGNKMGKSTYTSPTVALWLVDGTTMLFAFDPNCTRIDPTDNQSDTTACLSMVYDINGSSKPNKIGKDIMAVNAEFDLIDIGGLLVAGSDSTYAKLNTCSGGAPEDIAYDPNANFAHGYYGCSNNYWAGAKKACMDKGLRIPTEDELNLIYTNRAAIAGTITGLMYWTSTETSVSNVMMRRLDMPMTAFSAMKDNTSVYVRCVK